jgi:hypothetical protein
VSATASSEVWETNATFEPSASSTPESAPSAGGPLTPVRRLARTSAPVVRFLTYTLPLKVGVAVRFVALLRNATRVPSALIEASFAPVLATAPPAVMSTSVVVLAVVSRTKTCRLSGSAPGGSSWSESDSKTAYRPLALSDQLDCRIV